MDTVISLMADALLVPVVLIAAIAILRLPRWKRWQAITRGTIVSLTALWIATVASKLYSGGVRPFVAQGVEPGASFVPNPGFPSDHALLGFAAFFVVLAATRNLWLSGVLLVLSAGVALGRVLALVHSPEDVIGSFFCVAAAAFIWYGPKFRQTYDNN